MFLAQRFLLLAQYFFLVDLGAGRDRSKAGIPISCCELLSLMLSLSGFWNISFPSGGSLAQKAKHHCLTVDAYSLQTLLTESSSVSKVFKQIWSKAYLGAMQPGPVSFKLGNLYLALLLEKSFSNQ